MNETSIISLENLSKSFRIIKNKETTLKAKIVNAIKRGAPKEHVIYKNVLQNFNFEINRGETIGIIGENGAGKSTTLKLIAKIIEPDSGSITVRGTVASLLEIGAGFQADMTGKENVYLYGTILGLTKKYLDEKYDEIVAFAELSDFMETPVKNYSSGMYMRLAFSVAVHVDPDIILIDEVLAVGDINFQKKCLSKLEQFQSIGKTIIFVSHDMTSVRKLCTKVVYLFDNGHYRIGPADQMVNYYFSRVYKSEKQNPLEEGPAIIVEPLSGEAENLPVVHSCMNPNEEERARWGNKIAQITEVYLSDQAGNITNIFESGQNIIINMKVFAVEAIRESVIGIAIYDEEHNLLAGPNSKDDGFTFDYSAGETYSKIILQHPPLLEGDYLLTVALYDYNCREPYDHLEKHFTFRINNVAPMFGKVKLDCEWIN